MSSRWMFVFPLLMAAQTPVQQEMTLKAVPYYPKPATTIRTETSLVDIGVVVRDSKGHAVEGLTKASFEVRDENKPREIAAFTVQRFAPAKPAAGPATATGSTPPASATAQPRWVGMVFEDIDTPFENLYNAKAAAKRFLKDGLAANDRVGIFTTSSGQILTFTTDVAKIAAAIDDVKFRGRQVRSTSCPLLTEYDAYRIANGLDPEGLGLKAQEYGNCSNVCPAGGGGRKSRSSPFPTACDEAVNYVQSLSKSLWAQVRINSQSNFQSIEDIVNFMSHLQGTRVMLLASSGFVSGTLETEEDRLIEKALHANVVINALDAKGLYTGAFEVGDGATARSITRQQISMLDGKSSANDILGNLADATGGLFFHNNNDLDEGFHEVGMQPEVSYLLGISPDLLDSKYHHLKVILKDGKRLTLQARKGYVASPRTPAGNEPALPPQRRLDSEVFTTSLLHDAPVTVSASSEQSPEGNAMARLTFHVDIATTNFRMLDGARQQRYRMIAALFDAEGGYVAGVEGSLDFALTEATYQKVVPAGLNADLHVRITPGSYRLRTVVVEGDENGRYALAMQPVEFK
jgi:VWFA-related protein